mmetsp:Transcript_8462/g.28377  ORF Transcript_8462/g.28377 Transcript_8462/m.28377 type:complete len:298 (+) Transcript_8462:745-1638(+)
MKADLVKVLLPHLPLRQVGHGNQHVILQIPPHRWKVNLRCDPQRLQLLTWPDAAEEEKLWGLDRSGAQDDLCSRVGEPELLPPALLCTAFRCLLHHHLQRDRSPTLQDHSLHRAAIHDGEEGRGGVRKDERLPWGHPLSSSLAEAHLSAQPLLAPLRSASRLSGVREAGEQQHVAQRYPDSSGLDRLQLVPPLHLLETSLYVLYPPRPALVVLLPPSHPQRCVDVARPSSSAPLPHREHPAIQPLLRYREGGGGERGGGGGCRPPSLKILHPPVLVRLHRPSFQEQDALPLFNEAVD